MRRLCLHRATQLTATLVGVAMGALEGEHNPGRVPTVTEGDELLTMQVFHVEDNSHVEGRCAAEANTAHLVQTTIGSDMVVWHEKDERARLSILCAAVPEESASKPRRGSELHQTHNCQLRYQGQQQPSSAA